MKHPGAEAGIACPGTAMERHTVKANKKAFVFFGSGDALVKLAASIPEAKKLARSEPERYRVGANNWVKVTFADGKPPLVVLKKWIAESYALLAIKPARAAPRRRR